MFGSKDWSDLPGDVWFAVGLKLDAASDRIRFRAVSKSLRSHLPFRHPPWLMLSEIDQDSGSDSDSDSDSDFDEDEDEKEGYLPLPSASPPQPPPPRRRFVILGEQSIYEFDLPQVYQARCVGSTHTWLTISKTDPTIITLLNPFSKLELHLPSQTTFLNKIFFEMEFFPPLNSVMDTVLHKAIICPSFNNFLVIAVERNGILAMAKPGDCFWTTLNVESKLHTGVIDMVVFKETLFAVNIHGLLLSCDIPNYPNPKSSSPLLLTVVGQPFDKFKLHPFSYNEPHSFEMLYLVECCGHLLLVIKFITMIGMHLLFERIPVPNYKTERFQVYRFDFINGDWIEVDSLGEYSLFLGKNTSVSVLATEFFGLVKKNSIYFTDDFHFGYHGTRMPGRFVTGVFDLDDNSITPNYQATHYQATSIGSTPPPIWIVPN